MEDFVGARSVEQELGLESLGVPVSYPALTDGGRPIVHPRPAPDEELGDRTLCVGGGVLSTIHSNKR